MNLVPPSETDEEQKIRVSAYLDLRSQNMIKATGALIRVITLFA